MSSNTNVDCWFMLAQVHEIMLTYMTFDFNNRGSRLTCCTGCTGAPNFFFLGAPAQKLGAPKFSYRQY